jgi:hypothetical protein
VGDGSRSVRGLGAVCPNHFVAKRPLSVLVQFCGLGWVLLLSPQGSISHGFASDILRLLESSKVHYPRPYLQRDPLY